jgi:ribonuclease HI
VIFSDSLSSLQAIEFMYPKSNPILTEIQDEIGEMKILRFVWTPGHAGISGIENVDKEAEEALRECHF